MRCHDIRENLSAYIDGMLEPSIASRVEEHLASCAECRVEYDELLAVVEMVRELPEVAPPPEFRAYLRQRVSGSASVASAAVNAAQPRTRKFFAGRWVGVVAAAAVVFLTVGVTALWYDQKGGLPMSSQLAADLESNGGQVTGQAERAGEPGNDTSLKQPTKDQAPEISVNMRVLSEPEPEPESSAPESDPDRQQQSEYMALDTGAGSPAAESRDASPEQDPAAEKQTESVPPQPAEEEQMQFFITALSDEEKAARDAAPPGMGGGKLQAVEYTVSLQVYEGQDAVQVITGAAGKYGGTVEPVNQKDRLVCKVPDYAVEQFIQEIALAGEITDRQSRQVDLLPGIQELESDISELMAREKELAKQLDEGADEAVEDELAAVRQQLASLQGELAAISKSAMTATVEIKLNPAE